jgi:hypothetical protein
MKYHIYGAFITLALVASLQRAVAQGTAFTYQGRLSVGTNVANGSYDLKFSLYDAVTSGNQVGGPLTNTAVSVSNGLFMATLDFGAGAFTNGAPRWLKISARTNGAATFTDLAPLQELTAEPYAITAGNITGTLPSGQLAGAYTNAVTFSNTANAFAGNGAGLAGVNAATVGGLTAGSFWNLVGNAGTTAGTNFVGTTDNQPLELHVNGQRAFRLEPTIGSPNVIGGSSANSSYNSAVGVTIGGGAANIVQDNYSTIAGGVSNSIPTNSAAFGSPGYITIGYNTIGGGNANTASGQSATIAGGSWNYTGPNNYGCTVGGGISNGVAGTLDPMVPYNWGCTIAGGIGNSVLATDSDGSSPCSTISGGTGNGIDWGSPYATIGGGSGNLVFGGVGGSSTIAGGSQNSVNSSEAMGSEYSAIGGGIRNSIAYSSAATIGGGWGNSIADISFESTIGGGNGNSIGNGQESTIGGGGGNTVTSPFGTVSGGGSNSATNQFATVAGGSGNVAGGPGSFIGGGGYDGSQFLGNTASSAASTIGGGTGNSVAGAYGTIAGGASNSVAVGSYGTIAGGAANTVGFNNAEGTSDYSVVGGGSANSVGGRYATIAGGAANEIFDQSDYCAIGGGSSNSINEYAEFSYIGGGSGNHILGEFNTSWATIGGGNGNLNEGWAATIGGGAGNWIQGWPDMGWLNYGAFIGGGTANVIFSPISGGNCTIAGGYSNTVNVLYWGGAAIGGGVSNQISASYGTVPGGIQAAARNYGQMAYSSGQFAATGDAQTSVYVCRGTTSNTNLTELFLDGVSAPMIVPTNSTWGFDMLVTGRASNGNSAAYEIKGAIKNNSGTVTIVGGLPVFQRLGNDDQSWDVIVGTNSVNQALSVKVQGASSTSIRWVASVRTVEVTY